MKVAVTGGAGFIGSHIVDKLLLDGYEVVVVDNLSTGLAANVNPAVRMVAMDIGDPGLLELFTAEKFDYVIHQAAQTAVPVSLVRPDFDCQVNIAGMVNVLECCRKTAVRRVVFASSAAVYGNVSDLPLLEGTSTRPTSFYGLSKLVGENYLALYNEIYGLNYVVLRYANVYGERQGDGGEGGVVSIFTRKINQGQAIMIFGDGNQTRDFIYVGDVAAANVQALVAPCPNAVYNVSTQTEIRINDLVTIMAEAAGKEVERQYSQPRVGDIYRSSLSNEAAGQGLLWRPRMDLAEGIRRTYLSLRQTGGEK